MSDHPTERPAVLFISNVPWDFVWQRHQTLASLFAEKYTVVFCEVPGIRTVGFRDLGRLFSRFRSYFRKANPDIEHPSNLHVLRPFALPATNAVFCFINRRLLSRFVSQRLGANRGFDLIVNYSPSRSALYLIDIVPHQRLVYDCTDDWLSVHGIPSCLDADERKLLASADLTVVPSETLLHRKSSLARRCVQIPHGVLVNRFLIAPGTPHTPGTVTLLYYGHLHRQHLDFKLIDAISAKRPFWRIVLIGPVVTPHAFGSNVIMLPQQPHEKLSEHIAKADLLILPYLLNAYTQAVMPAKSYECLATGRPIVASPLPELVRRFPGIMSFAGEASEWIASIEAAISTETTESRQRRIDLAMRNSWESRFQEFHSAIFEQPPTHVPSHSRRG